MKELTQAEQKAVEVVETPKLELKCIYCFQMTETSPCEHCGSRHVYDPKSDHQAHWSRKTMQLAECKVCGRTVTYIEAFKQSKCSPV